MIALYHMFLSPVTKENIHLYYILSLGELKTMYVEILVNFRAFPAVFVCRADQDSAAVV